MSKAEVKNLQRALNRFTHKHLYNVAPLLVDGKMGASTRARIRACKYYLGYLGPINSTPDMVLRKRMFKPNSIFRSSVARVRRGQKRRSKQKKEEIAHERAAHGVERFDGRMVAAWIIPYLVWARHNGWRGTVVSGFRDPGYSESLCYRMCGRPSCPGKCAGRSSNHSGKEKPRGAVDLSDYFKFGLLMRSCPYTPHLFNALPYDRVHYSASGR